jgi:DNA replication protein DnaD
MANELKHWLNDMAFAPEFLFCLLEMCFERNIFNPRQITKIAGDIKQYSINSLEGLELFFNNNVKPDKLERFREFDPEIIEFGDFTGIDMGAEARKSVYYKWRYDWAFSHKMIMKAGEIMCQRTRNGGLEYIDSVLKNWMSKEIRSIEEAEKEMADFKSRTKKEKSAPVKKNETVSNDYEIYIPPSTASDGKKNV